ncbi:MAG TPA: hypothetical protein VE086_01750 [Chthoniobacterales bacterium]|nr:hypothetical protein [Chthoniobacterales bacterium]
MTASVLFCAVVLVGTSVSYGEKEAPGVAGVDVIVKQTPGRRDVTNAWGIFALDPLPAGSYTLTFKARPANKSKEQTRDKVIVATSYSIKIEGTKRPIKQTALTSDQLVAGVDIAVEVGAGAKIRGTVLPSASKKMVWIPKTPGTNLPGHWVEEGSNEASRFHTEVYGPRDWQSAHR